MTDTTRTTPAPAERCPHDMVAAWCAPCKGTDDPEIVPSVDEIESAGGHYSAPAGRISPRWYLNESETCSSCGRRPDPAALEACCS